MRRARRRFSGSALPYARGRRGPRPSYHSQGPRSLRYHGLPEPRRVNGGRIDQDTERATNTTLEERHDMHALGPRNQWRVDLSLDKVWCAGIWLICQVEVS
ncbi:hypothetical protein C8Q80DRAFT_552660 [Daedaleopsis nitida]|nr:hypothetical protein C8Q80DRAFT_552660 [Daedaleopsis nitida]